MINEIFGIHFLEARAYTMVVPKIKQEQKIVQGKHKKNLEELKTLNSTMKMRNQNTTQVAVTENMKS